MEIDRKRLPSGDQASTEPAPQRAFHSTPSASTTEPSIQPACPRQSRKTAGSPTGMPVSGSQATRRSRPEGVSVK
jgi:hypothetical protein